LADKWEVGIDVAYFTPNEIEVWQWQGRGIIPSPIQLPIPDFQ
jgi:hypothetical protein